MLVYAYQPPLSEVLTMLLTIILILGFIPYAFFIALFIWAGIKSARG